MAKTYNQNKINFKMEMLGIEMIITRRIMFVQECEHKFASAVVKFESAVNVAAE